MTGTRHNIMLLYYIIKVSIPTGYLAGSGRRCCVGTHLGRKCAVKVIITSAYDCRRRRVSVYRDDPAAV